MWGDSRETTAVGEGTRGRDGGERRFVLALLDICGKKNSQVSRITFVLSFQEGLTKIPTNHMLSVHTLNPWNMGRSPCLYHEVMVAHEHEEPN